MWGKKRKITKIKINFTQIYISNLCSYDFCCQKEQQQKSHLLMCLHEIQVLQAIVFLHLNLLFPVSVLGP